MIRNNEIINITVQITILIIVLLASPRSSTKPRDFSNILSTDMQNYIHADIPFFTIKSTNLEVEEFALPGKCFVLIKDLSSTNYNSPNTSDIIATDIHRQNVENMQKSYLLSCFYTEVENNGIVTKKCVVGNGRLVQSSKSIFIIPRSLICRHIFLNRASQAEKYKNSPSNYPDITSALQIIRNSIHEGVYRTFIDYLENYMNQDTREKMYKCFDLLKDTKQDYIKSLGPAIQNILKLFELERYYYEKGNISQMISDSTNKIVIVWNTIKSQKNPSIITDKNIEEMKEEFAFNIKIISMDMENRKRSYIFKDIKDIKKDFADDLIVFVKNLTFKESRIEQNKNQCILEQEAIEWNKTLQKILLDRLNALNKLSGSRDEVIEKLEKENEKFIKEVMQEWDEIYISSMDFNILRRIFMGPAKKFSDISTESMQSTRSHEGVFNIKEEEKKLELLNTKIVKILDDLVKENCTIRVKQPKSVQAILSNIREKINQSEISNINIEVINIMKKKIANLIFMRVNGNSSDIGDMKFEIRYFIETIIDLTIHNEIKRAQYRYIDCFREENERNRGAIESGDLNSTLRFIIKQFDKYNCDFYRWKLFLQSQPQSNASSEIFIYKVFNDLHTITSLNEWLMPNIYQFFMGHLFIIYGEIYYMNQYIDNLKRYDEIWKNPVFLIIENPDTNMPQCASPRAYITYLVDKNGAEYSKEISFTNENLEAFRSAKTMADIEAIRPKTS